MERPVRESGSRHQAHDHSHSGLPLYHLRYALSRLRALVDRSHDLLWNPRLGVGRIHNARTLGCKSLHRRMGRLSCLIRSRGRRRCGYLNIYRTGFRQRNLQIRAGWVETHSPLALSSVNEVADDGDWGTMWQ